MPESDKPRFTRVCGRWNPAALLRCRLGNTIFRYYGATALHATYEMKRINHEEAYSLDGACTNWAEEFFSRMRRAEAGHHHHIAGPYLLRYAQEASLREDYRRISNGDQVHVVSGLAMKRGPFVDFCGYWQR